MTCTILLCCPRHILALTQENKGQIITEEWKTAEDVIKRTAEIKRPESIAIDTEKKEIEQRLPEAFQKNITVRANNVGFRVLLKKIARVTGYNIIFGPGLDIEKVVSVDVADVPVWRALNTILFSLNYGFKITDKDLVILAQETRSYKITLPPGSQSFTDTISNESGIKGSEGSASSSISSSVSGGGGKAEVKVGASILVESKESDLSIWKDIGTNLAKLVSIGGSYSLNKQAGVVVVTDNPVVLDKIGKYIELMNTEAGKQIFVEVKIVEVTLSNETSYGIDWNAIYKHIASIKDLKITSNFAAQNISSGNMFTLSASAPNPDSGSVSPGINAAIRALETQGKVKIVSQPKVMLLNNQSAVIQVGTVTSYVSSSTTNVTQGVSSTSATIDQVQEGVSLRLIATILDNAIAVQVTPVITTVDQIRSVTIATNSTIEAPKVSSKSMHTLVKIKDGETIAIGGLISSKDTKSEKGIPLLRKIPFMGRIFEYKTDSLTNTELVVFITPKIINK